MSCNALALQLLSHPLSVRLSSVASQCTSAQTNPGPERPEICLGCAMFFCAQDVAETSGTKICRKCVCLQKIYLFAPEGSTQDRSRSRPPPAPAASPAKRAKTGNLDEEAREEQLREANEPEEEERQTQQADADEMAAERSSTSRNLTCICMSLLLDVLLKAHQDKLTTGSKHHDHIVINIVNNQVPSSS